MCPGVLLTLRGEESLLVVYNKDLYHKSHIFEGGTFRLGLLEHPVVV